MALTPLAALADASARAYIADERVTGQVTPAFVHGAIDATSQVGVTAEPGYAYAYANLDTGTLRVAGNSIYAPGYTTTADASANIRDTLTFSGGSRLTGYLDYSFDGSLGVVADAFQKAAFAQLAVNIGTVGGSSSVYETLSAYPANCGSGVNCEVGNSTARNGSLAFQIVAGAPTDFSLNLSGFASIGNSFDFSNTAKFYLRLPDGVNYTSTTGSFLMAALPITPVPEPSMPALMLAGLGIVGLIAKRRKLP
jgi:hypothetical protein